MIFILDAGRSALYRARVLLTEGRFHEASRRRGRCGARGHGSQSCTRAASGHRPAGHYEPPARSSLTTGPLYRRKRGPTPRQERRGEAPKGAPACVTGRWSAAIRRPARSQDGPRGAALPHQRLSALHPLGLSRAERKEAGGRAPNEIPGDDACTASFRGANQKRVRARLRRATARTRNP